MSFNEYLKESINESGMGRLYLKIQDAMRKILPRFIENGTVDLARLKQEISDSIGVDISQAFDDEGLKDMVAEIMEELQKGEYE